MLNLLAIQYQWSLYIKRYAARGVCYRYVFAVWQSTSQLVPLVSSRWRTTGSAKGMWLARRPSLRNTPGGASRRRRKLEIKELLVELESVLNHVVWNPVWVCSPAYETCSSANEECSCESILENAAGPISIVQELCFSINYCGQSWMRSPSVKLAIVEADWTRSVV